MADKKPLIVSESIETKILTIRGQKVMLDANLADSSKLFSMLFASL